MKEIKLSNNKGTVLVDNENYEWLSKYKWNLSFSNKRTCKYAKNDIKINDKQTKQFMHRLIMNPFNNMQVDHIDGNGLNNQKSNLRIVTNSQNGMNRVSYKNTTSIYKGVSFNKQLQKWESYIGKDCKKYHIGFFIDEKEAARAYNNKAKELFGEYANLNEVN